MNRNILILVFLGLMAAAAIYSVTLFNRVAQQKKQLAEKEASLSLQLDSNKILKEQLTSVLKQLQKIEPESATAGTAGKNDEVVKNVEKELKNINEASIKLNEPAVYQQAKKLETEAFEAIANNQFETAMAKFNQIEKITPSFHSSYEISKLLNKQRTNLNNPEVQQNIKSQILKNYSWKAPADQIKKIELQVKQKESAGSSSLQQSVKDTEVKTQAAQLQPVQPVKTQLQVKPGVNTKNLYNIKTGSKQ